MWFSICKTRADVIIPASTNAIFRTYPDCAVAAPYGTYFITPLEKPESALWTAVSASHRRHVRSAEKPECKCATPPEYVTEAHTIIRDTFAKSSLPFMAFEEFARLIGGLEGISTCSLQSGSGKYSAVRLTRSASIRPTTCMEEVSQTLCRERCTCRIAGDTNVPPPGRSPV